MQILKINEFNSLDELYFAWNKEYGNIFPISKLLFDRNTSNSYIDASFVAVIDNQLAGFIIGKVWVDEYEIKGYNDCGWVNLIYVLPQYRKRGIGTSLLEKVESEFKKLNKCTIYIGRDYLNYFPGLPCDLKNSLEWFKKRGYDNPYNTYDLICSKNKEIKPLTNLDYTFRCATLDDKENLIEFMYRNWPGRWTKEVIDYYNNGGTGKEYLLILDNDKICAFAKIGYPDTLENLISYSLTWRDRFERLGGIGPLGVDKEYRGRHLGSDIVIYSKNTLIDFGVSDIIIDWTGLLDFYRPMGFEVWKSYFYLIKLNKGD